MHRIMLEEDCKTSREHQRRINPVLSDVVKKEVQKLLEVGIIYLISDSKWVSPVHVVSKKVVLHSSTMIKVNLWHNVLKLDGEYALAIGN